MNNMNNEKNSREIISLDDISLEEKKSNFTYNINNDNILNKFDSIELLKKNLYKNPIEAEKETEIYFILNEEPEKSNEINNDDLYKIIMVKKKGENISKFKFNYLLNNDSIQDVINELIKVVNLNSNEIEQCEKKLKIFISELKAKNKEKEKNELEQQINLINNCYEIFMKEYNDNVKQIQELNQLYNEIKKNEKDYSKEEITDIDNKMKILAQLK